MFARLYLCLTLFCALPAMAQLPKLDVGVERVDYEGADMFNVRAQGQVAASPESVWKILTHYEAMTEFVPDLKSTRVLSRLGNRVVVEQNGVARFLFFKRAIHLVVEVNEEPMSLIDISILRGDMKIYNCRWELIPVPETGGTRIVYSGKLVPKFYVPGVLGANLIRSDIERMMKAVLAHLDR